MGGIHKITQSGGGAAHVKKATPSTDPVSTSFKRPWIRKIRVSKPKDSREIGTHMHVCKPLREKSSCAPSDCKNLRLRIRIPRWIEFQP
jgi:hypothetical protein